MSNVTLDIAGRKFTVACAEGEEAHIAMLGRTIDAKLADMPHIANQSEARALLFAALLLADENYEMRQGGAAPVMPGRRLPKASKLSPGGSKAWRRNSKAPAERTARPFPIFSPSLMVTTHEGGNAHAADHYRHRDRRAYRPCGPSPSTTGWCASARW